MGVGRLTTPEAAMIARRELRGMRGRGPTQPRSDSSLKVTVGLRMSVYDISNAVSFQVAWAHLVRSRLRVGFWVSES